MDIPYLDYFGLAEKPFSLTPDPLFYFESRSHREALDHLAFFLSQKEGFALIYGDVGTGKTTLSRIFLDSLEPAAYNSALILNPIMTGHEFLKEVLKEFSVGGSGPTQKEGLDALREFLLEAHREGRVSILVIDEAQLISNKLFDFIRILSNFETEKEKTLHIVFFAQPEIVGRLQQERMKYLAQRITVTYDLKPLDLEEVGLYINYRLVKAGSKAFPQFRHAAVKVIHEGSRGYPRLVNVISDRCMLLLYTQSRNVVTRGIARTALKEQNLALTKTKYVGLSKIVFTAAISAAICALLSLFWWDFIILYRVLFSDP
jgi:general secretion pathway protein A